MNLFRKKQIKHETSDLIGRKCELAHDITKFQRGTVFIDGVRYAVEMEDGSELCFKNMIEIVDKRDAYLVAKKVN